MKDTAEKYLRDAGFDGPVEKARRSRADWLLEIRFASDAEVDALFRRVGVDPVAARVEGPVAFRDRLEALAISLAADE